MISLITSYTIVRYLIGGGTSAFVNLSTFYLFHYVWGFYYINASIVAFVVAFFVSLAFHKFWTFKDHSMENIHIQGIYYLGSSLFGLFLNTSILYISVDYLRLAPFLGQIIAGGLTACCTFFISKNLIFNRKIEVNTTE